MSLLALCLHVVGGPKGQEGRDAGAWGVQGILNLSVSPQDRELRPEEIEGKGLGKELEFPECGAVGGGLSTLQEEQEGRRASVREYGDKTEQGGVERTPSCQFPGPTCQVGHGPLFLFVHSANTSWVPTVCLAQC